MCQALVSAGAEDVAIQEADMAPQRLWHTDMKHIMEIKHTKSRGGKCSDDNIQQRDQV